MPKLIDRDISNPRDKRRLALIRVPLSCALLLIAASAARADTAVNLTAHGIFTGYDLRALTAADINGDGKADLIGVNANGNAVSVHLNTTTRGAVEPIFAAGVDFATGATPVSAAAADVNGDGKADLIVANFLDGTVSVLLNTTAPGAASPSFAAQQTFGINAGADSASCVIAADINGDGKLDIAIAKEAATTLAVLINTTTPGATVASFAPVQIFPSESYATSLAAADINGDGKLDLIVAASNNNEVSVLLNTTASDSVVATFADPQAFATAPDTVAAAITSADINADGKPDLIVANALANSVSVLLNATTQAGSVVNFAAPQSFAAGANAIGVVAGDVDGDGKPDIVVANDYGTSVSVLIDTTPAGASGASFATQQVITAGAAPFAMVIVDVNGDDSEDVIVADNARAAVSVLLNTLVNPDQHGITGSWFNPATGGQGFEIEAYPDAIAPGHGSLFVGWFTYDVTAAGGRRWYGLTGDVSNANALGTLQIFDVEGGRFDAPPALGAHAVLGQATIRFTDCNTGSLNYAFSDGSGRSGTIPLVRLTPNAECSLSGYANFPSPGALFSGNWFNPATSGQGFMFDFSPPINTVFAAWYTFAKNGQQIDGASGQRWFTLQSDQFLPGVTSLSGIPLIESSGGVFNTSTAVTSVQVGTAAITIESCNAMTLNYQFTSGESNGSHGTINLQRAGPAPQGCSLVH